MKKYILLVFSVGISWTAWAQIVPSSSQPFQLMQSYNPAFTGVDGFTSAKIGYRNQWMSFPDAPKFLNVVLSTRIENPADIVHHALRTGSTDGEDEVPLRERTIQGLGFSLTHEKYGVTENLDVAATYAYHLPVSRKVYLALGVSPSISNSNMRLDRLDTADPDRYLEFLQTTGASNSVFNLGTGLACYSTSFYFHLSYLQAWTQTIDETVSSVGFTYIGSAGFGLNLRLGPTTSLKPSVFVLMDERNELIIDYSVKAYLGNRAWGGLQYRDAGFGALILGFEFSSAIGVSYSYEMAVGGLKGSNNGSNEIILGLKLANLRKQNSYLW